MKTFFSAAALASMRSSGYRHTTYALAELVDNSFDAGATKTKIIFFEKRDGNNRRYIDEIIVSDNGLGMPEEVLYSCLTFGATTNTNLATMVTEKKMGKFGFGLPNASLSQCKFIKVYSWQKSGAVLSTKLDLQESLDQNTIDLPPVQPESLPSHYEQASAVLDKKHGVIISWQKCDMLSAVKGETLCDLAQPTLGQIYRHLLAKGSTIQLEVYDFNESKNSYTQRHAYKVIPNDPLFLMSNTQIAETLHKLANSGLAFSKSYKSFSTGETTCRPTNIRQDDLCQHVTFRWQGKTYKLEIVASAAHIDIQKPGIKIGASTEVGTLYGKRDSISFVRANREIATGDFGFYRKTEPQHRWWSIEVKFDADLDNLLNVYNTKQGVNFTYTDQTPGFDEYTSTLPVAREEFQAMLSNKLQSTYSELWKLVRKQGREWDEQQTLPDTIDGSPEIVGSTATTNTALTITDGKRDSVFADDEKQKLAQRLAEKFPEVPEAVIKNAIVQFEVARLKSVVLYHASADQSLWTMTQVHGFLITLINKNHSFYTNIMLPLRQPQTEQALAALELFISSLSAEEYSPHFMQSEKRTILEEFRAYVGIHLNAYIRDNAIDLESTVALMNPANAPALE